MKKKIFYKSIILKKTIDIKKNRGGFINDDILKISIYNHNYNEEF